LPADADVTGYEKPKRYPYELSVGDKKYIVQFYSGAKEPMGMADYCVILIGKFSHRN
jgi:hypothetical protein